MLKPIPHRNDKNISCIMFISRNGRRKFDGTISVMKFPCWKEVTLTAASEVSERFTPPPGWKTRNITAPNAATRNILTTNSVVIFAPTLPISEKLLNCARHVTIEQNISAVTTVLTAFMNITFAGTRSIVFNDK